MQLCLEMPEAGHMNSNAANATPADSAADIRPIRKAIDGLCTTWDRAAYEPERIYRQEVDERRAIAIHTHAHHAVRLARALRTLDEAEYSNEMIPLVRQIFEDGVTAAWLLITPGSGDILIKNGTSQRKKAQEHMIKLGHTDEDSPGYKQSISILDLMEDVPSSYQFEQRCLALHSGSDLYLTYRTLSIGTHAGIGIADYYSVESADSPIGVEFDPSPIFDARTAHLGIAGCLLLLAINADEKARAKPHRTTQIERAAKLLGVDTAIRRSDGTTFGERS